LALDLGLEAQQLDRDDLIEPLTLHDDGAGLLDAGVMLHRKPQRRPKRLVGAEVGPAWVAGKILAGNPRILQECVHRRALAESHLRTGQGASGPAPAAT
jgi:hypothetical protein